MEVGSNAYSLKEKRLFPSSRRPLASVEAFHLHEKESWWKGALCWVCCTLALKLGHALGTATTSSSLGLCLQLFAQGHQAVLRHRLRGSASSQSSSWLTVSYDSTWVHLLHLLERVPGLLQFYWFTSLESWVIERHPILLNHKDHTWLCYKHWQFRGHYKALTGEPQPFTWSALLWGKKALQEKKNVVISFMGLQSKRDSWIRSHMTANAPPSAAPAWTAQCMLHNVSSAAHHLHLLLVLTINDLWWVYTEGKKVSCLISNLLAYSYHLSALTTLFQETREIMSFQWFTCESLISRSQHTKTFMKIQIQDLDRVFHAFYFSPSWKQVSGSACCSLLPLESRQT